jgi:hypothetical protein
MAISTEKFIFLFVMDSLFEGGTGENLSTGID